MIRIFRNNHFALHALIIILTAGYPDVGIAQAGIPAVAHLQYALIGNFKLENGQSIDQCKIAYQTFGKLNKEKNNVVLFPTWFTGTSMSLLPFVPGKMIDTTKFFLILADALGDGLSSSPSNSQTQPGIKFPAFSIRDMVESQHVLLTAHLNIDHLYAVSGVSMGGMQSFQWAVSYPGFADKIIPISGSPQLNAPDLLLWNGELQGIQNDTAYHDGNYTGHPLMSSVTIQHEFAVHTPAWFADTISRDSFDVWLNRVIANDPFDWNNRICQLRAMIGHDIAKSQGGSLQNVAKQVRAKMLIIVGGQDHMVNPSPAIKMAGILNAQLLILNTDCGHTVLDCELEKIVAAIHQFMN
ncbi:MAG TPA: alpha/beta fold hydrolase [Puia sp.]|nr:alpha/beta fold hydrolase [Puia sp.]